MRATAVRRAAAASLLAVLAPAPPAGAALAETAGAAGPRTAPRPAFAAAAPVRPAPPPIEWRRSRSLGTPDAGRLVRGVMLPRRGPGWVTWDPALRRRPNRPWRRFGSDRLVRAVLRLAGRYARRFPDAPPLLVGDLSRTRGGDFGPQFGGRGHVSHQNGLDVDVYFPRADGRLRPPRTPTQIARRRAQALVDLTLATRPERVFVGPGTSLTGPAGVVQVLGGHDDHLHLRLADR